MHIDPIAALSGSGVAIVGLAWLMWPKRRPARHEAPPGSSYVYSWSSPAYGSVSDARQAGHEDMLALQRLTLMGQGMGREDAARIVAETDALTKPAYPGPASEVISLDITDGREPMVLGEEGAFTLKAGEVYSWGPRYFVPGNSLQRSLHHRKLSVNAYPSMRTVFSRGFDGATKKVQEYERRSTALRAARRLNAKAQQAEERAIADLLLGHPQ